MSRHPDQVAPPSLAELVLVRHGESVGNVADRDARRENLDRLDLATRDADTPLSDTGEAQAAALGERLVRLSPDERPDLVLSSPYERAVRTAAAALHGLEGLVAVRDERLRERDLGLFDGLTGSGIRAGHPDEARRREAVGKLYYRPPGGESWTDVALRVRQVLADLHVHHAGRRVWVFTHQAVIMCFRFVLEGLTEEALLRIERDEPVANCSTTRYRSREGRLCLEAFDETTHVEQSNAPTTHEPPRPQATSAETVAR